jgi:hypothetical protein
MKITILLACPAMIVTLLLTGCVSTSNVGVFSQAASMAATNVANGFDEVQETTITRRLSDVAAGTNTPTDKTFTGLLDAETELAPRLKFLSELQKYANSLGALANANYRPDVDAASKDLYGALNGLAQTYQTATAQSLPGGTSDTAIIAAAVDGIGNIVVEAKRQAALRKIITKTDPAIQAVCADLQKTFNGLGEDRFVYENLNSQVADMTEFYNQQKTKWTYDERLNYLGSIRRARTVRDGSETFITAAGKSIAALAKAHRALADSARFGKLSSAEAVQAIGELASEASKAKQFYDQIHSPN